MNLNRLYSIYLLTVSFKTSLLRLFCESFYVEQHFVQTLNGSQKLNRKYMFFPSTGVTCVTILQILYILFYSALYRTTPNSALTVFLHVHTFLTSFFFRGLYIHRFAALVHHPSFSRSKITQRRPGQCLTQQR